MRAELADLVWWALGPGQRDAMTRLHKQGMLAVDGTRGRGWTIHHSTAAVLERLELAAYTNASFDRGVFLSEGLLGLKRMKITDAGRELVEAVNRSDNQPDRKGPDER